MARSKLKKKRHPSNTIDEAPVDETKIAIPNLPDKYLWMKVKSGTKMRNVLKYSLKEFPSNGSIVWSGAGEGIGRVISCVEVFKRKIQGLHQITKLRYVPSKTPGETAKEPCKTLERVVPEIHVLLSRNLLDTKEPGYQAPGMCSMFQDAKVTEPSTKKQAGGLTKTRMSELTAEEFASMGLRTVQKRPRQQNQPHASTKKFKKSSNANK